MSKLIVEMEMPKCCDDCSAQYDCMACAITGSRWYGKSEFNPSTGRLSDCPIKGVLPDEHGDLIDRDEAFYDIKRFICNGCNRVTEDDCMTCITKGIQDILCYIKPIIVAERKDDEQIH